MPTHLTRADVTKIALLARLDLTDDEAELFTHQLAKILEYAESLKNVDTENVKATWHQGDTSLSLRPDILRTSLTQKEALANAPQKTNGGLFRVPKVIG